MEISRLISTGELSKYSGISKGQLVRLRNYQPDRSPPFLKLGRQVFYSITAFDAWLAAQFPGAAK